jgi:copper homeostasis protein
MLEIACFHVESVELALKGGADRIEFCKNYHTGGYTPELADIKKARAVIDTYAKETGSPAVPLHVMIRVAESSRFVVSDVTKLKEAMRTSAPYADGFVFGCLTSEKKVDAQMLSRLVAAARSNPRLNSQGGVIRRTVIFHRAIDEVSDPAEAIQHLAILGIDAVLSSGGGVNAVEGAQKLKEMVEEGKKHGVEVIVGGSVRRSNITQLKSVTGATWYHSSAKFGTNNVIDWGELVDMDQVKKLKKELIVMDTASREMAQNLIDPAAPCKVED